MLQRTKTIARIDCPSGHARLKTRVVAESVATIVRTPGAGGRLRIRVKLGVFAKTISTQGRVRRSPVAWIPRGSAPVSRIFTAGSKPGLIVRGELITRTARPVSAIPDIWRLVLPDSRARLRPLIPTRVSNAIAGSVPGASAAAIPVGTLVARIRTGPRIARRRSGIGCGIRHSLARAIPAGVRSLAGIRWLPGHCGKANGQRPGQDETKPNWLHATDLDAHHSVVPP